MIVSLVLIDGILFSLILAYVLFTNIDNPSLFARVSLSFFILFVLFCISKPFLYSLIILTALILIAHIIEKSPFTEILFSIVKIPVMISGLLAPFCAAHIFVNIWFRRHEYPVHAYISFPEYSELIGLSGIIFCVILGFSCLYTLVKLFRSADNIPTSGVGSVSVGLAEFAGKIQPATGFMYRAYTDCFPFYLNDETGKILVDPGNIYNDLTVWNLFFNNHLFRVIRSYGLKQLEYYFSPGSEVYVLGNAEINKKAPPELLGSERLIIAPSRSDSPPGIWKRLIPPAKIFSKTDLNDTVFILSSNSEIKVKRYILRLIVTYILLILSWTFISFSLIAPLVTYGKKAEIIWSFDLFKVKELLSEKMLTAIYPERTLESFPENTYKTLPLSLRTGKYPLIYIDFNCEINNHGSLPIRPQKEYDRIEYSDGVEGKAGYFDGTDYLKLFKDTKIPLDGSFTIEFWFKPEKIKPWDDTYIRRIIFHDNEPGFLDVHLLYQFKKISLVADGLAIESGNRSGNYWGISGYKIFERRWYHFACVLDKGTGILSCYLDGKQIYSSEPGKIKFWIPETISNLSLGQTYSCKSNKENFQGWLDEFYFYDCARKPDNVLTQ